MAILKKHPEDLRQSSDFGKQGSVNDIAWVLSDKGWTVEIVPGYRRPEKREVE